MNFVTDLADAIMFGLGLKTVDAENPIERKHVSYGIVGGAALGWFGGIQRAKRKPTVNALGI